MDGRDSSNPDFDPILSPKIELNLNM